VSPFDIDAFVHDLAKLGINRGLVVTVAARADDAGTLADEAIVLIRPLDPLDIPDALLHD
jgi:hypothetical protein